MEKRIWRIFAIMFMASPFAFASTETIDLSGMWKYESTLTIDDDYTLVFIKTPFHTHLGGELYLVIGNIRGDKIWGASVENFDGVSHIAWWLNKGERFDGESNMILDVPSPWLISLGGDFETFECATLTKVAPASGGDEGDVDCGEGTGGGQIGENLP